MSFRASAMKPAKPGMPAATGKLTRVLVAVIVVGVALGALLVPLGPSGCNGTDCYSIPLSRSTTTTSNGAPTTQTTSATSTILFPGTVTYSDGSSTSLSTSQTTFAVITGAMNKAISQVNIAIVIRVAVNSTTALKMTVTGYVDETASRRSTDSLGQYMDKYNHFPVSVNVTLSKAVTPIQLLNINRTVSDFVSMSDLGSQGNATHFTYALVGSITITFSAPLNRTVPTIFSWPNSPISISVPSTGPATTGGSTGTSKSLYCPTKYACYQSIASSTQGVKFAWFAIGTTPTFSVASASGSVGVMRDLGVYS